MNRNPRSSRLPGGVVPAMASTVLGANSQPDPSMSPLMGHARLDFTGVTVLFLAKSPPDDTVITAMKGAAEDKIADVIDRISSGTADPLMDPLDHTAHHRMPMVSGRGFRQRQQLGATPGFNTAKHSDLKDQGAAPMFNQADVTDKAMDRWAFEGSDLPTTRAAADHGRRALGKLGFVTRMEDGNGELIDSDHARQTFFRAVPAGAMQTASRGFRLAA